MKMFLIPTVFAGKVAMEYKVLNEKVDRRTKLYRDCSRYIVDPIKVIRAVSEASNNICIKGERMILKNGEAAYKFKKAIKKD